MKKQNTLPEIIKTYIRGFAVMGAVVMVLLAVVLVMYLKGNAAGMMQNLPVD